MKARYLLPLIAALLLAMAPFIPCRAQETKSEQSGKVAPKPVPEIVMMSEAHRALQSFSGVIKNTSGWQIERTTETTLAFRRPDRLRAVVKHSDSNAVEKVLVDSKNVYVFANAKWTKKPFKPGDNMFALLRSVGENAWISTIFTDPHFVEEVMLIFSKVNASSGEKIEKGEARLTYGGTGTNDQANVDYKVEFAIGKSDHLLRVGRSVDQPSVPWNDSAGDFWQVEYISIQVNPTLSDTLFAPPVEAQHSPTKSTRKTKMTRKRRSS